MTKEISDKITPDTILVCTNNDWEGPAKNRLKEPGEENGVKGNYRVCPVCKSKDFYIKEKILARTYSISSDVENSIEAYLLKYGLPEVIE